MSTILIIEDEARIAAFIAKGLKSAGFASHATASGAEGASLSVSPSLPIRQMGSPQGAESPGSR